MKKITFEKSENAIDNAITEQVIVQGESFGQETEFVFEPGSVNQEYVDQVKENGGLEVAPKETEEDPK